MIEIKDLVKIFDGFPALNHASLAIPTGSVYGLVGPNGAGKTTLLRLLSGVYQADGGEILFDGVPVYETIPTKEKMCFIADTTTFPLTTIREMKKLYENIYPNFSKERFEKLSTFFPYDQKKPLRTFSKGQKKQVAFWLALSARPQYLLLDEPMDGLDPIMRHNIWSLLMKDVTERNLTVIVSSHNLRELEDVCDMVGIMEKGNMILERSLEELQGNTTKLQVVFPQGGETNLREIPAIHVSSIGRVYTIILRMSSEEATQLLEQFHPVLIDAIPLTLEEIFIYELGGVHNAIKEILS